MGCFASIHSLVAQNLSQCWYNASAVTEHQPKKTPKKPAVITECEPKTGSMLIIFLNDKRRPTGSKGKRDILDLSQVYFIL